MPRTGRGGSRQGEVGTAYENRTDLNTALPVTTAPDQPYGERAQQQAAQGSLPMATPPNAANVTSATTAGAPTAAGPATPAPRPVAAPGSLPWTSQPTNRPNEPVTAGLPFGPGPGPQAQPVPPLVSDTLAQYASTPNASSSLSAMASVARSMGI